MLPIRLQQTSEYHPRNPEYREAVQLAFTEQTLLRHLGAKLQKVEPGFCEIHLPYSAELTQNHGYFHGGAVATLADVAGGFAGWSLLEAGRMMLTVEYKTNIVAPGQGDALIGRGWVVKSGRTLTITEVEIYSLIDGEEQLCATALQTLMSVAA